MKSIIEWLFGVDTGQTAGAKDWRVGFISDYGNYVNLALLVAFVAMVYLTIRSYRREGDAPVRKKALLAGIRITAIVLLFVVVLRPAIVLNFERVLYNTVVVAVDGSQSMSYKDHYTDEEMRKKVAESIGVEPVKLEDISRLQIVTRGLTDGENVLAELARNHRLVLLRFSTDKPGIESYTRQLAVIEPPDDDEDIDSHMEKVRKQLAEALGSTTAAGYETNMSAALRDALESVRGRRVAGIVMIGDGQNTSSNSQQRLRSANEFAKERGVPVYSVAVGDPTPPKNLRVTALRSPREVRVGSVAEFTAVISHRNLKGETVKLNLYRRAAHDEGKWTDTNVTKDVVLDGKDEETDSLELDRSRGLQTVRLQVTPDKLGDYLYKVVVEPRNDEQNPDDNEAEASLQVLNKQIRVLLVGGDAGWEFQYLRNFLHRQKDLYRVSVWQQDADEDLNQMASTGMKLSSLPRDITGLVGVKGDKTKPGYDVVILYDPQPTVDGFDKYFCEELLQKFVDMGGGLCYIAGNKYSEAIMDNREYWALAVMLPVVLAPNERNLAIRIGQTKPEAWPVSVTSYGLDHQAVRLGATAKETEQIFGVLPGIYWSHPVAKVKPTARVLATSSNPMHRTSKGKRCPLIATQSYGGGKVLYIGFEGSWRWRFVRDGYYHRQYWGNIVRYLADKRIRRVVITVGGDRFSAGEKITIEAEAKDENYKPINAETFDVEMVDVKDRTKSTTITLTAVPKIPGKFRKTITAGATGTFEVTALAGDPNKVDTKKLIIELPQAEARKSESNPAVMKSMASRSENFLWVQDVDKLSKLIPSGRFTTVQEIPQELWDSKAMLILVVLLLAVELIIRKRNNMA